MHVWVHTHTQVYRLYVCVRRSHTKGIGMKTGVYLCVCVCRQNSSTSALLMLWVENSFLCIKGYLTGFYPLDAISTHIPVITIKTYSPRYWRILGMWDRLPPFWEPLPLFYTPTHTCTHTYVHVRYTLECIESLVSSLSTDWQKCSPKSQGQDCT